MSLAEEIRRTFERVSLQHEAAKGLNAKDWAQYREIQTAHERKHRDEQQAYRGQYGARVAEARQQLIDKAAQKERPFLPRLLGRDRFNRADIDRQAHLMVQDAHHKTLETMEVERNAQIDSLLGEAQKRKDLSNQLHNSFEQATDRRSGYDRRSGPKRLH